MRFRTPIISFKQGAANLCLGHATSPIQRGLAVATCAAIGISLASLTLAWHTQHKALVDERERVLSRQAQFAQRKPPTKTASPVLSLRETSRHNAAVAQLNTPWSDVFDGLERRAQADIGLTLLEPDTKKGTLRVQAEAKDIDSLLAYADRLASDPVFGKLSLQQHETNEQDPNRPARLSFEVQLANANRNAEVPR